MVERAKPSLRESKKLEVRRSIAQAAAILFESQGYAQTTVEEIAAAAKVSRPTVFNYFASKEAIVPAAFAEVMLSRFQNLEEPASSKSPLEAIRAVIVNQAEGF
ncbi:MAG: TetR family transcriptional regulator, partial [Cyanobacteria bacterium REEB65]|nr:TetR family transcriptional regulator [Cyanobacteria bacterium REEB65]